MQTLVPGTLTIGSYAAFAPLCWQDGDRARGRDIEFLRAFAAQFGLQVVVRFFEFDRLWERPGRDEIDLAAASIAPLASRHSPGVVWTEPYVTVQRSLLIRATDHAKKTIADFAGQVIAVTRGSTADLDTVQRKPATARVVYYANQEQAVHDLLTGQIDAFGTGDLCSRYLAEQNSGQLAVTDVHDMAQPEHFAFAVREASQLLDLLNAFIHEHRARY
ncbi:MAG: ABC transporter substrate-binding protein [Chloroflexi bacterium]|nr:ABC transporter substrate-binding protein [Chloroflexota bacterium]